jgi:hypothetical protein
MWLDAYTLDAMGQGVLYALPLLACSIASRTPLSRRFPVLREMHELQHDLLKHFTAGAQHTEEPYFTCKSEKQCVLAPCEACRRHQTGHCYMLNRLLAHALCLKQQLLMKGPTYHLHCLSTLLLQT